MNSLVFYFKGTIPSKKNSKRILVNRKTGRRFVSSSGRYAEWEREHVRLCKAAYGGKFLGQRVKVEIDFTAGTRRAFDLTNKAEGIMDVLVLAGMIDDDNAYVVPFVVLHFSGYEKGEDSAHVSITTLKN